MKKFLYSMVAALVLMGATESVADFYMGAGYGLGVNGGSAKSNGVRGKNKDSSVYSLQAGYVLPLPLLDVRGDIEYLRSRPAVSGQHARRLDALMASVSGVIPFIPMFDPYVGLGWGYARYDHTNTTAWQCQMGIEYKFLTVPLALGAEYRYLKLTENGGKRSDISKYHSNIGMLKAKFFF